MVTICVLDNDHAKALPGSKVLWEVSQAVAMIWVNCAAILPSFLEAKYSLQKYWLLSEELNY